MDRNFISFLVLSFLVIFGWNYFVIEPQNKEKLKTLEAQKNMDGNSAVTNDLLEKDNNISDLETDFNPTQSEKIKSDILTMEEALRTTKRVAIENDLVKGSILLRGLRLDDLVLKNYYTTTEKNENIRLLSPKGTKHAHYLQFGFITDKGIDEDILWEVEGDQTLSPDNPLTLFHENDDYRFEVTLIMDEKYMILSRYNVLNKTNNDKLIRPFGIVVQRNFPEEYQNFAILHEGMVGIANGQLIDKSYKQLVKKPKLENFPSAGGWVGITNKYWLASIIPPQNEEVNFGFKNIGDDLTPIFRGSYTGETISVKANDKVSYVNRVFLGPKKVKELKYYQNPTEKNEVNYEEIPYFDKAVDWGNFFFLTRPIFFIMNFFFELTGQFWLAIILLTLVIKAILYPLASKGYESMSKMKKIHPEMTKIREMYKNDTVKMQQETMALYKKEKVSPLLGCLPILIQMPIFYSLYKTLFVTIEMRHQEFLWIKDLSAKDPTSIFNLFGLLPYDPTMIPLIGSFLGVGVLPILMGVGMWVQTTLNPPPADPTQKQIFALLPLFFTFIFAPFAAGLVLYWFWNTVLSILQQALIMQKNGVEIELIKKINNLRNKQLKKS